MSLSSVHQLLVTRLRQAIGSHAQVIDATSLGNEEICLLLDACEGDECLLLHLLLIAPFPIFWLAPRSRRRPLSSSGFGDWLKPQVQGARVKAVTAGRGGRILELALTGPSPGHPGLTLVLDPLTNTTRMLVLDQRGQVIQRFPPPVHQSSSGRGQPGSAYREPRGTFREAWQRAGGPGDADGEQLWLIQPPGEASLFLSPVPAEELKDRGHTNLAGPTDPLAAAREAGRWWVAHHRRTGTLRRVLQILHAERRHLAKLQRRLAKEIAEAGEGELLRRQAEALLASGGRIPRGATECTVPDPVDFGQVLRVPLDPKLTFGRNAERLFKKAGRMERSLGIRSQKSEQIAGLEEHIGIWLDRLARGGDPSEIHEEARALKKNLETGLARRWQSVTGRLEAAARSLSAPQEQTGFSGRRAAGADPRAAVPADEQVSRGPTDAAAIRAGIHPRRHILPGGWLVLVGRSNAENDTLTHRVARQRDLWFHARGVSGSHVVLQRGDRKDNPSKETLVQAAGIAAYYSKARTSGMAPVVYTEKRYVRKPRKAPAGLAVCIREKVLMVKPRLPPEDTQGHDAR